MTKKELMIKAHKMTKEIKNEYPAVDYKFQLGLCLAYLNQEGEKEMVELKGTEKQISWAKEIREDIIKSIMARKEKPTLHGKVIADALGDEFPAPVRKDLAVIQSRIDKGNFYLDTLLQIVENEENAAKIINARDFDIDVIERILRNGRM